MKGKINRNDPCPCGSGKKYKNCHEGKDAKKSSSSKYPLIFGGLMVVLIGFLIINPNEGSRSGGKPGQVWSEEHGHWHDAPAATNRPAPVNTGTTPASQPAGDPPPGKVWSEEHGHWHDDPNATTTVKPQITSRPPGPAPEGKVWSEEHGHWHNIPGATTPNTNTSTTTTTTTTTKTPQPPGPVPEGKVWSEEHGHWHNAPATSASGSN